MESVFIAALLAATPATSPATADMAALDRRCFALMASLAEEDDPRVRDLGRVAAQYFLGRIDAVEGVDAESPFDEGAPEGDREGLLRACGDALAAGGVDFGTIGEALAPAARPAA